MSATRLRFALLRTCPATLALACFPAFGDRHNESSTIVEAVTGGEVYGQFRARYEFVDEENFGKDANAVTLRTRLGYKTGLWKRFQGTLEFEDVRSIGAEKFNSTTNGKTSYPVVPDPESTEVNQAILAYTGFSDTLIQLGRQYISLDNERWIGPVNWRQNSVTMDAITLVNQALPGVNFHYGYIDNVNRLFGEDHPTMSDWEMDSHIVNVSYAIRPSTTLVGYGYFLAFEDSASQGLSTRTLGLRANGAYPLNGATDLLYTLEYANQSDYADGLPRDEDYYWVTAGVRFGGVTVKLNREQLSGDGTRSVTTPLATVHAHNGWADRFLATALSANGLPDGIVDNSVELSGTVSGVKLVGRYHSYSSDNDDYDYGDEWNLLAARKISPQLKLVAKYAYYSAAGNATNVARNPTQSTDVQKFWLMADFTF